MKRFVGLLVGVAVLAVATAAMAAAAQPPFENPFPDWLVYLLGHPMLRYAVIGFSMGILHDAIKSGGELRLPRVDRKKDGAKIVRLGFLLAPFTGMAAAMLADHHSITAALAGWVGPDGLESLLNIPAAVRQKKAGG